MEINRSALHEMKFQAQNTVRRKLVKVIPLALLIALLLIPTSGQRQIDSQGGFRQRQRQRPITQAEPNGPSFGEYTFIRTIYDSPNRGYGGYGRRGGTWSTDYPNADWNFIVGLREWTGTNLKIAPRPEQIAIMDDRIFDYPI